MSNPLNEGLRSCGFESCEIIILGGPGTVIGSSGGAIMQNILRAIILIAMLNFSAFWYGVLILGGSAGNGKEEGGRFFVGEHGKYTEVAERVYIYSRFHGISLWVTNSLGIVAGLILLWRKDPFITNRNKRRDYVFLGITAAIVVVDVVTSSPTLPFWLFPLIIIAYALLSLRDANRQQARGERSAS
jgi:hypothetical protein